MFRGRKKKTNSTKPTTLNSRPPAENPEIAGLLRAQCTPHTRATGSPGHHATVNWVYDTFLESKLVEASIVQNSDVSEQECNSLCHSSKLLSIREQSWRRSFAFGFR
jgi:hypothetical protein